MTISKTSSLRSKRAALRWAGLGMLVFALLCIGLLWVVFRSGAFEVQDISVEGTRLIKPERFIPQFAAQLVGGSLIRSLLGPRNILFWKIGSSDPVISPFVFPALSAAHIDASLLKRRVVLRVEERAFFGIWCSARGECYAFDKDGVLFVPVPGAAGSLFLTVFDTNAGRYGVLGAPFLTRPVWIQNIISTLAILRDGGAGIAAVSILNLDLREWEVKTGGKSTFRFDLAFIPDQFEEVLKELGERLGKGPLLFDFRVPNRVYYR